MADYLLDKTGVEVQALLDAVEDFDGTMATTTNAGTDKVTPVDTDNLAIAESGGTFKKLSWANVKATLKTYFDTLYEAIDSAIMRTDVAQTMSAKITAQANTDYTTAQVRNITLSTSDASGGSNGDVWIKYTD